MGLLLLICLLASVQPHAAANTCTAVVDSLKKNNPPLIKDTRKCLQSIPYKKSVADGVIDTIQKTYEFWPYLDIAKNAPDSRLPSKIDVFAELRKIKSRTFPNALSFHKTVYDVIKSINDGHSAYLPWCFAQVVSLLPVSLYFYVEKGANVYKIAPANVSFGKLKLTKPDLTKYWGATVHKINGVDASVHLKKFADKSAGVYKDLGQRFNSLFATQIKNTNKYSVGAFTSRRFPTDEDNVTFEVTRSGFKSREVVTIPIFTSFEDSDVNSRSFVNATYYDKLFCQPYWFTSKKVSSQKKDFRKQAISMIFESPIKATFVTRKKSLSSVSAGPTKLVDGLVQSWLLPDKKTGVLIIFDFYPQIVWDVVTTFGNFMSDVNASCQSLLRRGASRLIIDLQSNPGGYSIIPDMIIQYLFPSLSGKTYDLQFRGSSLSQKLVNFYNDVFTPTSSWFHYLNWWNTKNVPFKSPKGFFLPVVSKTLGGIKGNYSSLLRFQTFNPISRPKNAPPLFSAKNILLLTNGLCYSSCGSFTYRMEEFAKVRSVTVGGFTGVPMAYSAGTLGATYNLNSLLEYDLPRIFKNEPNPFPILANLGFAFIQSYSPSNSSIPADYVFKPSTYRLPYSSKTVLDKGAMWTEVAKFF